MPVSHNSVPRGWTTVSRTYRRRSGTVLSLLVIGCHSVCEWVGAARGRRQPVDHRAPLVAREGGRGRCRCRAGRALGGGKASDAPGELLAAEGVLEAVAGDLARLVQLERVEQFAVKGHLPAAVRPLDGPQLARKRAALRRRAADGQGLPEGEAGTVAEHHAASLLIAPVEGAALGIDQDHPRTADLLGGHR